MRTYLSRWFRVGVVATVLAAVPFLFSFGADSASISYLKSKPLSPWSIMALAAAGENPSLDSLITVSAAKAIDLEAPMLALAAAGKDPHSFGSENLVAKLRSFYDGTQLGETGIINDDIFGLLALIASGEKPDDAAIAIVKSFILSQQNTDGGFSFAVGGASDTNTTAAAIMALRAAGLSTTEPSLANAKTYLQSAQNSDGGFPYDPKSSWGTASDASSDAWVMMAATALGENVSGWQREGKTPVMHLETLKQTGGFYLYQTGGAEDSFTSVTTSYALLALSGKTLPVRVIVPDASSAGVSFSVQVEGKSALLCDTDGTGRTALDALKYAAATCSLAYHIQSSSVGEYVDEIVGEKASGSSGWLYSVNGAVPSVGAGAYALKDGDAVRWFYGNFDGTAASDALRTEIPLSVTIPAPPSFPPAGGQAGATGINAPTGDSVVSMLVEVEKGGKKSELGFGTAARGAFAQKSITLKNGGVVATTLSTSISGDAVFRRYVRLNDKSWRDYHATLAANTSTTTTLSLSIPADYSGSGVKQGALIFWATPAAQ